MRITCTNCSTSYEIESASLGLAGRSVRCARCSHMWFVANTAALAAIADEHRADVTADAFAENQAASPAEERTEGTAWPEQTLPEQMSATAEGPGPAANAPAAAVPTGGEPPWPDVMAQGAPVVVDAPPLAPTDTADQTAPAAKAPREDIETVAARRYKKPKRQRVGAWKPGLGSAILALVAINLGLVAWRNDIARALPQTASLYAAIGLRINLRGLDITGIETTSDTQDGVVLLSIEGTIANPTSRPVDVPRLRFSLRNDHGLEIYNWTAAPGKTVLAPGETLPFRTRLASPSLETHLVFVRFLNRRDLVASNH